MKETFISNPEISNSDNFGLISLADGIFVFTTKINTSVKDILDIEFSVCDENEIKNYGFFIKNTAFNGYKILNNSFITETFDYIGKSVFYFDEEFQIKNEKLYKKITNNDSPNDAWADYYILNGNTYASLDPEKNNKFKLIKANNKYQIAKNIENIKPLAIGSITNSNIKEEIIYDGDDFYPGNDKIYRIIVSEKAKLISLWVKNKDENFKKIKTFSYPGGIEKAGIKLSYENNIKLSELSFSFFKANV